MAAEEKCDFCHEQVYTRQGGITVMSGGGDDLMEIIRQASMRKLVCPKCGSVFCLVCGNKKGKELGTGASHCPKCGTRVL